MKNRQRRVDEFFTRLLKSETTRTRVAARRSGRPFNWFHPPDAIEATTIGYPFARPFTDPIAEVFATLDHAAGRTFTIQHVT